MCDQDERLDYAVNELCYEIELMKEQTYELSDSINELEYIIEEKNEQIRELRKPNIANITLATVSCMLLYIYGILHGVYLCPK
jgi:hypothetical protein